MEKNENGYPCCPLEQSGNDEKITIPTFGARCASAAVNSRPACPGMNQIPLSAAEVSAGAPLAYVYAPDQKFCMLYSAKDALSHGTLFEQLYKPLGVYGHE